MRNMRLNKNRILLFSLNNKYISNFVMSYKKNHSQLWCWLHWLRNFFLFLFIVRFHIVCRRTGSRDRGRRESHRGRGLCRPILRRPLDPLV